MAFTGVANAAFRDSGVEAALSGGLSEESIAAAAARAADGQEVLADHFAGEEYRPSLGEGFRQQGACGDRLSAIVPNRNSSRCRLSVGGYFYGSFRDRLF